MQTIKYKFADATTNEVEVTEEIYLIHLELLQHEKRNHWEETRRHTSLYYFTDMGIDFEDSVTSKYCPQSNASPVFSPSLAYLSIIVSFASFLESSLESTP